MSDAPKPEVPADPMQGYVSDAPAATPLFQLMAGCFLAFVALGVATMTINNRAAGVFLGITALVLPSWVFCRSLVALYRAAFYPYSSGATTWLGIFVALAMSGVGVLIGLGTMLDFARGRQLRRRGQVLLPSVGEGAAWTEAEAAPSAPEVVRGALAAHWRENGRTEHASVAAFAQLTTDFMALGAPPALLADAQRDALDEIRHAELCFSQARALDGRAAGPRPFPEVRSARRLSRFRSLALAELAVDSLIEGALLEGFSARLLAELVPVCDDPSTQALLRELAADEGRHSKHGWDAVAWCLAEGGEPVRAALAGAALALAREVTPSLPAQAADGSWERFGVPSQAREAEAYRRSRAHVTARLHALLAAHGGFPAAAA
jgi:hypothetical protein